jgi:ATP-dependent helicase/nuclease subunit B
MTFGLIPPGLDQVLVGSIERSRHPNLKAVFLIGTTQNQFPSTISKGTLLTDADRLWASTANFSLAPASDQQIAQRQYLAYIAFTRPSEFLCVTYPAVDEKSKPMVRSQFISNLEELFDDLCPHIAATEHIDIESISSQIDLEDLLCGKLGKDSDLGDGDNAFEELLEDICQDVKLADAGQRIKQAITYQNIAGIDIQIAKQLFGGKLNSSATKLAAFAACPYQYFLRYVLGLDERKEFKFRPLDIGTFYHNVLDAVVKKLIKDKQDLAVISDQQLLKILQEQISGAVQLDSFISSFAQKSRHNMFIFKSICENLESCVLAVKAIATAGVFRPIGTEIEFQAASLFKLFDGSEVCLKGKVDRFDAADVDGQQVGIVFDYKRKSMSFSWRKFYHGLDLQLPIYMLLALNGDKITNRLAGAFYMPVEAADYKAKGIFDGQFFQHLDSSIESGYSKFYNFSVSKDAQQYGNYGKSGALMPHDFQYVLNFARNKIIELCEKIVVGKIDIHPYRMGSQCACSNCIYQSLCRFDWQTNEYNVLPALDKQNILGSIKPDGR